MRIIAPADDRDPTWLALRLALWPEISKTAHFAAMKAAQPHKLYVRVAISREGYALGFIEAAKRTPDPGGDQTAAVAFIEALYVPLRGGIAKVNRAAVMRRLVEEVGLWAAGEGCSEVAFDSRLPAGAAEALRRAFWFKEGEGGIYFHKLVA